MAIFSKRTVLGLAAVLTATALAAPTAAQEADGTWVGVIEAAPGTLVPLAVHIKRDDAGTLIGTMDSPAQGVQGLPLDEITVEAGSLAFTVLPIGGNYKGQWDAAANAWKGEWSQAGQRWPLSFTVPTPPLPADWQLPPNDEIAALTADRNAPRSGQGIVVGVLGPDERRIVSSGPGQGAAFDGDTLFEIGLDHQGLHGADPCRHGQHGRSRTRRSGGEVPAAGA